MVYLCVVPMQTVSDHVPVFLNPQLSNFHVIHMDWLANFALVSGIILLIIGVSLVFHLPAVLAFLQEILGFLCIILGGLFVFFFVKLAKSA